MVALIGENLAPFILALVFGVLTAWWIWAQRKSAEEEGEGGLAFSHAEFPDQAYPEPPPATFATEPAGVAAGLAGIGDGPKIPAAMGPDDDLTQINGIGPKLSHLCQSLGVRRFDQIAGWNAGDMAEVDSFLGGFSGRIVRDQWVDQAKLLATGQVDQWQNLFGYKTK